MKSVCETVPFCWWFSSPSLSSWWIRGRNIDLMQNQLLVACGRQIIRCVSILAKQSWYKTKEGSRVPSDSKWFWSYSQGSSNLLPALLNKLSGEKMAIQSYLKVKKKVEEKVNFLVNVHFKVQLIHFKVRLTYCQGQPSRHLFLIS